MIQGMDFKIGYQIIRYKGKSTHNRLIVGTSPTGPTITALALCLPLGRPIPVPSNAVPQANHHSTIGAKSALSGLAKSHSPRDGSNVAPALSSHLQRFLLWADGALGEFFAYCPSPRI